MICLDLKHACVFTAMYPDQFSKLGYVEKQEEASRVMGIGGKINLWR